jgi:type I restriction enzyme S subunit
MFGEPTTNPMGWEAKPLGKCGTFKNGMNYTQRDSGYNVRCLGVGDFGDLYRIDSVYGISEISLSVKPAPDYLLRDGDIVFVRSNGNRELVGRSVEIFPGEEELTFSGFCIRYRNESPDLLTLYLNHTLHLPSMKAALLSDGRGANIQNVNQQALSNLLIPLPPLDLQTRFAAFAEAADKSKFEFVAMESAQTAAESSIMITDAIFGRESALTNVRVTAAHPQPLI